MSYVPKTLVQADELQLAQVKSLIKEGSLVLRKEFVVEDDNGQEVTKSFIYIPLSVPADLRDLQFRVNITIKLSDGSLSQLQAYKTTSIGVSLSSMGDTYGEVISID